MTEKRARKPGRKATLNKLRKELIDTYHALSTVSCDDRISTSTKPSSKVVAVDPAALHPHVEIPARESQLNEAITLVSAAINCINRELGRKENSPR